MYVNMPVSIRYILIVATIIVCMFVAQLIMLMRFFAWIEKIYNNKYHLM